MSDDERIVSLRIDALVQGGDGIARRPGKPVTFIPRVAVGELVSVELERTQGGLARGRLLEVIEPSPSRRTPPCPETTACGGCQWQHLQDEAQAQAIETILPETLRRIGKLDLGSVDLRRCIGLPSPLRYRRRARFHAASLEGGTRLGFHGPLSRVVHEPVECLVLEPELERIRRALARCLPEIFRALPDAWDLELAVDLPHAERAVVCLVANAHQAGDRRRLEEAARVILGADATIRGAQIEILTGADVGSPAGPSGRRRRGQWVRVAAGEPRVAYRHGVSGAPDRWPAYLSPGGFLQASRAGNELIVEHVLAAVAGSSRARMIELYAGNGNLSLPLAESGADLVTVESDAAAARNASLAAREAALAIEVRAADVAQGWEALAADGRRFDVLVLDPPRTGCATVADAVARSGPPLVVYVSCDAGTLARDAATLVRGGYRLESAQPLAIFPQTAHFETVAVLRR